MRLRARPLGPALVGMAIGACGPTDGGAPSASSVTVAPVPVPSTPTPSSAEIDDELSTRPVELLKLTVTSAVEDRQPKDVLTTAKPGTRVYAHLVVRNRSGRERKVHVVFRVNGEVRSEVDLNVGNSWSWRTWAYATLTARDVKGKVAIEITDDEGHPVGDAELPIRP